MNFLNKIYKKYIIVAGTCSMCGGNMHEKHHPGSHGKPGWTGYYCPKCGSGGSKNSDIKPKIPIKAPPKKGWRVTCKTSSKSWDKDFKTENEANNYAATMKHKYRAECTIETFDDR